MSDHSRRTFLKTASIGAAAAGAAAVVPFGSTAGAATPAAATTGDAGPAHAGPFVAWVNDPASGEVSVLVGEHEVVVKDAELAKQLARLAAKAGAHHAS